MTVVKRTVTLFYVITQAFIAFYHNQNKKFFKNIQSEKSFFVRAVFNKDFLSANILFFDLYEKFILEEIVRYLPQRVNSELKNLTIIDIGANIGNHSLFFSLYFKKVVAVEPNPLAYKLLEINTAGTGNIESYQVAISNIQMDSKNELEFISHKSNFANGHVRTFHRDLENFTNNEAAQPNLIKNSYETYKVKTLRLDDLLLNLGITPPPEVLKIDVEGSELEVIQSASKFLSYNSPVLLLELVPETFRCDNTNILLEELAKYGYTEYYTFKSSIDMGEFKSIRKSLYLCLKTLISKNLISFNKVKYPNNESHRLVMVMKKGSLI
jgi:FkbM family methyltransferase